jgi:hypothetical protein
MEESGPVFRKDGDISYGNAKYFGIFSSQNERGVWRPGIGAMVALYVG